MRGSPPDRTARNRSASRSASWRRLVVRGGRALARAGVGRHFGLAVRGLLVHLFGESAGPAKATVLSECKRSEGDPGFLTWFSPCGTSILEHAIPGFNSGFSRFAYKFHRGIGPGLCSIMAMWRFLMTVDPRALPRAIFSVALVCCPALRDLAFSGWLTIPEAIPETPAGLYARSGQASPPFNAGGCSSCHAVPAAPPYQARRRPRALPVTVRTFLCANIIPRCKRRIGRCERSRDFRQCGHKGLRQPERITSRPFPIRLSMRRSRMFVDPFCLSETLTPVGSGARSPSAVSVQASA